MNTTTALCLLLLAVYIAMLTACCFKPRRRRQLPDSTVYCPHCGAFRSQDHLRSCVRS